ncbi:hypothetical protein JRQ81_012170 [Phrynocephalus forsythii]|uniref:Zinc finger protein RFP-like n=1 Tax=Phrynocephalus forsythii TaxID=171643 RepID=A0A9Q0X7D9_9SAUR|nr:hypothetical protein JRQ81_012170 [Phrynocephalus forsythii]
MEDPVTIECGHNFCRACLAQCWEGSEGEEVPCPQCRENIRQKLIIPNRQLANFVELTQKLLFPGESTPTEGKRGVCGKHQEPLKLFCKEDQSPICVVCDRSKDHRDHDVVPLEEAAQDYKDLISSHLEHLEGERAKILASKTETEGNSQELLKQIKAEMEKMKEQFRELHSFLNEQEKLLLAELEEVEKEITRKREEHLARLSEELSSLGGLIQEMEEKCQQPPRELLQDVRFISQRCERKEPFQSLPAFPPELKWKFWDICDRTPSLAVKMKQFRDTLLLGSQLQKANVTLDPQTVHPCLILTKDRKSVKCSDKNLHSADNPNIYNLSNFVLGCEEFTAGRHCWEATVGSEEGWAVGVARKSVQRKDTVSFSTKQGIWAVGKWSGEKWASNLPNGSLLPLSENLRRICVSLNCDVGKVSFYDGDTGSHLYTFSGASFSGKTLLPFFYVQEKVSFTISP